MLWLDGNAVEWNMIKKNWWHGAVKMSVNCDNICVSMLIKGHPLQKKALSSHLNQITYFVSVSKPPSPTISMLPPYVHKQRNFSVSCWAWWFIMWVWLWRQQGKLCVRWTRHGLVCLLPWLIIQSTSSRDQCMSYWGLVGTIKPPSDKLMIQDVSHQRDINLSSLSSSLLRKLIFPYTHVFASITSHILFTMSQHSK